MKYPFLKLSFVLLILSSSCSYFNNETVPVRISSNPQGANIIIEGVSYGQTPQNIRLVPKNYQVTLLKENYGATQINLDSWVSVRRERNDGIRCTLDAFGTPLLLPAISFFSGKCLDFKKAEYKGEIAYNPSSINRRIIDQNKQQMENRLNNNYQPLQNPYNQINQPSGAFNQKSPHQPDPYQIPAQNQYHNPQNNQYQGQNLSNQNNQQPIISNEEYHKYDFVSPN
jgi:hypothetical protein